MSGKRVSCKEETTDRKKHTPHVGSSAATAARSEALESSCLVASICPDTNTGRRIASRNESGDRTMLSVHNNLLAQTRTTKRARRKDARQEKARVK